MGQMSTARILGRGGGKYKSWEGQPHIKRREKPIPRGGKLIPRGAKASPAPPEIDPACCDGKKPCMTSSRQGVYSNKLTTI